jgi:RecA/RadA recombinase
MVTKTKKKETKADTNMNAGVSAFLDMTKSVGFSAIGSTDVSDVADYLPTFIPSLDLITGGGIPFKRFNEVYGSAGAGKSTLMVHLTMIASKLGVPVIWIDTEGTTGQERMSSLGIDNRYVQIFSPSTLGKKGILSIEKVDEIIESVMDRYLDNDAMENVPALVVWDGVAVTISEEEATTAIDAEGRRGRQAQAVTKLIKRVSPRLSNCNMSILVTNQVRANMNGAVFAPKTARAGGAKALDHAESLRLALTRTKTLTGKTAISRGVVDNGSKNHTGHMVKFTADKSKDGVSEQSTNLDVYTSELVSEEPYVELSGLDYAECIFTDAVGAGVIKAGGGGYYTFTKKDGTEVRGRRLNILTYLHTDDDLMKDLFTQTLMFYFPRRYPAMGNKNIDITKWKYWTDDLTNKYEGVTSGRL